MANGTSMVMNINATAPGAGSYPMWLTNVTGTLFFEANDGINGSELWRSDANGTVLVKDINPGAPSSSPSELTSSNGKVFFSASDGPQGANGHGRELWESDGTAQGTTLMADINSNGDSNPGALIDVNNKLFFSANDGTHGIELWLTKTTAGGGNSAPALVKDIW